MVYNLFKFVHIAAVIVWLGGLVALSVLNAHLAREHNPSVMAALAKASRVFGGTVVGPAAGVTLLAGIVMVITAGLSFATLWIAWGLGGLLLSMFLGATVIRRAGEQLTAQYAHGDQAQVVALQRRVRSLNLLNLLILFSVVGAMVFKPTL